VADTPADYDVHGWLRIVDPSAFARARTRAGFRRLRMHLVVLDPLIARLFDGDFSRVVVDREDAIYVGAVLDSEIDIGLTDFEPLSPLEMVPAGTGEAWGLTALRSETLDLQAMNLAYQLVAQGCKTPNLSPQLLQLPPGFDPINHYRAARIRWDVRGLLLTAAGNRGAIIAA